MTERPEPLRSLSSLTDGTVTLRPVGDDPQHLRFRVESRETVVGEVSLRMLEDRVGELRWSTEPQQRGRGFATRAARVLTRYALQQCGLARVQAYVDPGDIASVRIAGRSGLRREGVLRGLRPYGVMAHGRQLLVERADGEVVRWPQMDRCDHRRAATSLGR